jgi:hypothetical protein
MFWSYKNDVVWKRNCFFFFILIAREFHQKWILPSSRSLCGVRWFETDFSGLLWSFWSLKVGPIGSPKSPFHATSRRVITQKTEEFSSTAAEVYDLDQRCFSFRFVLLWQFGLRNLVCKYVRRNATKHRKLIFGAVENEVLPVGPLSRPQASPRFLTVHGMFPPKNLSTTSNEILRKVA